MGLRFQRAGMFTTVQDLGRPGHRASGVPLSGAMDSFALRVANLLVGNPESAAALELTLLGPEIAFDQNTLVAVGGAEFDATPSWQPLPVRAGDVLRLAQVRRLCRGYLAVAGGIDVPLVLGSRSTCVRARFGGHQGRVLRDGDVLSVPACRRRPVGRWWLDPSVLPPYSTAPEVRVVRGAQADEFDGQLTGAAFTVTSQSDRMGVRLNGAALVRAGSGELPSATVVPGTIQVPPDGQPIVLMADAQTIGGYPQVAHVIRVDLPLVAQLRPGDQVRFREVTLAEAHGALRGFEQALTTLRAGLAGKLA
jgi:antagonist of KipI